jgi:DNA invertase Pin-like site-specific DNA recombinase
MINVIGYVRVSTEGQVGEDKFGLDVQKQQIEEYAKDHNMNIVRWFRDEGESGAKERPGFDEIIYGEITNPPYEAVIVAKSDRVARDINVYYYYKMMLLKKDIKLISIAEDFEAFGVFAPMLEAFTLCVADMERNNINKRTSAGRKVKASQGGYSGGRAPMGYKVENKMLVVNPEEAPIVLKVFELRDSGVVMTDIVDALNREGFKTRNGKSFVISTVQSILNNRKTYEGYYRYGKDGEWVKGQHKALLN